VHEHLACAHFRPHSRRARWPWDQFGDNTVHGGTNVNPMPLTPTLEASLGNDREWVANAMRLTCGRK